MRPRRSLVLAVALAAAVATAGASAAMPLGVRVLETARDGRPLQIVVWYPAAGVGAQRCLLARSSTPS